MQIKNKYFEQAIEYYKNAKEIVKQIPVEYDFYKDLKKVRKAGSLCHLAVIFAIRGFLVNKGYDAKKVEDYPWDSLKFLLFKNYSANSTFRKALEMAYQGIHINIYYKGANYVNFVKTAFEQAKYIIEKLTKQKL